MPCTLFVFREKRARARLLTGQVFHTEVLRDTLPQGLQGGAQDAASTQDEFHVRPLR